MYQAGEVGAAAVLSFEDALACYHRAVQLTGCLGCSLSFIVPACLPCTMRCRAKPADTVAGSNRAQQVLDDGVFAAVMPSGVSGRLQIRREGWTCCGP